MSDRAREVLAQDIWQQYVVEVGRSLPGGLADRMATAIVAALEAAGIALVELPQPDSTDEDGLSWNDPHHALYVPTSEELRDGLVYDAEDSMTPTEARALAAALLAAAAAAEVTEDAT